MRTAHIIAIDAKGAASLVGHGSPDDMRAKFSETKPPKGGVLEYWVKDRPRPRVQRGDPVESQKVPKAHAEEPEASKQIKSKH